MLANKLTLSKVACQNSLYKMDKSTLSKPSTSPCMPVSLAEVWAHGIAQIIKTARFCFVNIVSSKQTCVGAFNLYWQLLKQARQQKPTSLFHPYSESTQVVAWRWDCAVWPPSSWPLAPDRTVQVGIKPNLPKSSKAAALYTTLEGDNFAQTNPITRGEK